MPQLIKEGQLKQNTWQVLPADSQNIPSEGHWLVPLSLWQEHTEELSSRVESIGIILEPTDDITALAPVLKSIALIAINFPTFADGRGFSLARQIREQLDYQGELRAQGYFLQDQLFYLQRCGFNAFLIDDSLELQECLESLKDFSDSYQAAVDEPQPLFRRRSHY